MVRSQPAQPNRYPSSSVQSHSVIRGSGRPCVGDLLPIPTPPPLHTPSPYFYLFIPTLTLFFFLTLLPSFARPSTGTNIQFHSFQHCNLAYLPFIQSIEHKAVRRELALTDFRTPQRTESDTPADQPATLLPKLSPHLHYSTISERRKTNLDEESQTDLSLALYSESCHTRHTASGEGANEQTKDE